MDAALLKTMIPINSLTPDSLNLLAAQTDMLTLSVGSHLFEQGAQDPYSVYLLSGEVLLTAETSSPRIVAAGTEAARYALAHLKPRKFSGIAKTPVTFARVDERLLDRLLTLDQSASYEVAEIDGDQDTDWMMRMLHSEAFRKLPPANAIELFERFQPVAVKAGQTIIQQDDPGDYYYLIKTGKAKVMRKAEGASKTAMLGHLAEGDGFGEEALLSDAPRNASVVMQTDGVLMRLGTADFHALLREPLVRWLTLEEVRTMVKAGAGLLDVRLEDEYRNGSIKGSINLPLYLLRVKAACLDRNREYVLFCQTGSRSCAAAFLLSQRGYKVSVLRGGLNGLKHGA